MATCQISIGRRIFPFDYPQKTGYFCGPFLEFWGSVRSEVSLRSIRLHERIRNQEAKLLGSKE